MKGLVHGEQRNETDECIWVCLVGFWYTPGAKARRLLPKYIASSAFLNADSQSAAMQNTTALPFELKKKKKIVGPTILIHSFYATFCQITPEK